MLSDNSHKKYYEIESFWNHNLMENQDDRERVFEIINSIPDECENILEVGCGNGAIVNALLDQNKYSRIVGVDISETALKYVKAEKYLGNINNLEFEDSSFDCVIASEVIEHLTYDDFKKSLEEFQRVSKKYIIISVPNEDDLQTDLRMCPNCHCWFNPDYHMNSFNKDILADLFDNFKSIMVTGFGPIKTSIKHSKFSRVLLHYYKKPKPSIGICPQCGVNFSKNDNLSDKKVIKISWFRKKSRTVFNILIRILFTKIIKKKRWLIAIYQKQQSAQ